MTTKLPDDILKRIFFYENDRIPNRRQAITRINDDLVDWRKYAALGER